MPDVSKVSLPCKSFATPGCLTEQPADTNSRASLPGVAFVVAELQLYMLYAAVVAVQETKFLLISTLGALLGATLERDCRGTGWEGGQAAQNLDCYPLA